MLVYICRCQDLTAQLLVSLALGENMCLEVYAVATANRVGDERLAKVSGLWVKKRNKPTKGAFYFSKDGGCSCSLMSENADWNNPIWDLSPEILDGLSKAIQLLGEESDGFTFQALWIGDKAESKAKISLQDLLTDIKTNKVKNKHIYVVGKVTV